MSGRKAAVSTIRIGPVPVRAEAADIAAFAAATGADAKAGVPLTFPIRWFARTEIRDAVRRLTGNAEGYLVHESQTFAYSGRISPNRDYSLFAEARYEHSPPHRLTIHGTITNDDGSTILTADTILRVVSPETMESSLP